MSAVYHITLFHSSVCDGLSSHRIYAKMNEVEFSNRNGTHYMPTQNHITVADIPRLMLAHTEARLAGVDSFKFTLANGQEVELITDFAKYVIEAFETAYQAT